MLVSGKKPIPGNRLAQATASGPGAVPNLGAPNGAASLGGDGRHVASQYRPATPSADGAQSAADKAKQDSAAAGGWLDGVALLMPTVAPLIAPTKLQSFDLLAATYPLLGSTWIDSAIVGGAVQPKGSGGILTYGSIASVALVDNLATRKWMLAVKGTMPAPASGKFGYFGLYRGDFSHYVHFGTSYAVGGNAQTNALISVDGTNYISTVAVDGAEHTWLLAWDGTNISLYQADLPAGGIPTATLLVFHAASVFATNAYFGGFTVATYAFGANRVAFAVQ